MLSSQVGLERDLVLFGVDRLALDQSLAVGLLLQMLLQNLLGLGVAYFERSEKIYFVFWDLLRLEESKPASQVLRHLHEAGVVLEHSAVVWCAEDGHEVAVREELVAVVHDHVAASYKIDIVLPTEILDNIFVKGEAHTSLVLLPVIISALGVRPEQVTEQPCIGDIRRPLDIKDLLREAKLRGEAAVHAEDAVVDES